MAKPHAHALLGVVTPGTAIAHWTVICEAARRHRTLRYLLCRCVCGLERNVFIGNLRLGTSSSCGCQTKKRIHGMSQSAESGIWRHIKSRCLNPKNKAYKNYGGRGITICDRWRDNFAAFLDDVGRRPHPSLTIDRIDNDSHYEPGNVRWATRIEQASNTRWTPERRRRHGLKNAMKRWHPDRVA